MNIELGWRRSINKDEALEILRKNEKDGLVLQPINAQKPGAICSCCSCCCGLLSGVKALPQPADFVTSNYYASIDSESCSGCETCIDRCQMEALKIVEGVSTVDRARCIGCGNCVPTCPEEAIHLQQKEKVTIPPQTTDDLYENIREKNEKLIRAKIRAEERKKKREERKKSVN